MGKGGKERIIPVGETALAWLKSYIDLVRSQLAINDDNLFYFFKQ